MGCYLGSGDETNKHAISRGDDHSGVPCNSIVRLVVAHGDDRPEVGFDDGVERRHSRIEHGRDGVNR